MQKVIIFNGLSICKTVNQLLNSISFQFIFSPVSSNLIPRLSHPSMKYGSLGMRLQGQYPHTISSRWNATVHTKHCTTPAV